MLSPIEQFRLNIERVQALGGLYEALSQLTTSAMDLTDFLRAQIVMAVSALDLYIHEITRVGVLEVYTGRRSQTNAFSRFSLTMDAVMRGIIELEGKIEEKNQLTMDAVMRRIAELEEKKQLTMDAVMREIAELEEKKQSDTNSEEIKWLDREIRERHGHQAFQDPDKIADAVRLFSPCELWPAVANLLNSTSTDVRDRLRVIIERRNKIVHESDVDLSNPELRLPISQILSGEVVDFIESICEAIHTVVNHDKT